MVGPAEGLCSPRLHRMMNPPFPSVRQPDSSRQTPPCSGKPTPAHLDQLSRWRDLLVFSELEGQPPPRSGRAPVLTAGTVEGGALVGWYPQVG